MAGAPARRPRDHRRLPVPERGARSARVDEPQGLSRELRRARAARVPRCAEGGRARGARAAVLAPHLRRARRRRDHPPQPRHRDRRRRERVADPDPSRAQPTRPSWCRTSSTSRSTSMRPRRTSRRWYVNRLLLLRETSLHDPRSYFNFLTRSTDEETRQFGRRSGARSTSRTSARTSRRAGSAPTWCWRRARTTACGGCACGSSSVSESTASAHAAETEPRELGDPRRELVAVDVEVGERAAADRLAHADQRVGDARAVGSSDAGRSMSVEIVAAAASSTSSTVRANSGSLRIDAPNSSRNDDRSPTANWKYARKPASTRSRPDVARPSPRPGGRAGGGRCPRAARRRARACSGSAGRARAW